MKNQTDGFPNRLSAQAAETIYDLRRSRKLKQSDLASAVDLSHRHLQKIEAGDIDLKVSTLDRFAKALDVPACYLIKDVGGLRLKDCGFLCPEEILGQFNFKIQINKIDGLVTYLSRSSKERECAAAEPRRPQYVWDFLADEDEVKRLKDYLRFLVEQRPPPTPYFTKARSSKGTLVPIKVDWKYLYDDKKNLAGFLSLITKLTPSQDPG